MATQKPIYFIALDAGLFEMVENFQLYKLYQTLRPATVELICLGLGAFEKPGKNYAPMWQDGESQK